jgi:pimeloyl-ACP methyl ester carboxylesterase
MNSFGARLSSGTENVQMNRGEHTMTEPKQVKYTAKARTTGVFGPLSLFLLVLCAATVSLAPLATVLAQQPAQTGARVAAKAHEAEDDAVRPFREETTMTQKEIAMTQLATVPLDTEPDTAAAAVRPFRINVPEAALVDLRRRVVATRWPDRETVADQSQGVQLSKIQELVRYWGTSYDWRKAEARLNALPQFVTTIDGIDIQFVHVRSRHPNAMPLIMTHGWPGSIFELLKVIGPLTDPTAFGGRAEDAFDLVLPSLPGYGFSGKPQGTGWGPDRIGRAWHELMGRLGYKRYVSQGGDWGAIVSHAMARQAPKGLLGIHVNMPATVPKDVAKILSNGEPAPSGLSTAEKAAFASLDAFYKKGSGYAGIMNTRPQTIGYGLADSPAGLAAFYYDKFAAWTYSGGEPERAVTPDEMLDNITLYWLTNTGTSSSQLYWEVWGISPFNAVDIPTIPVAVTVFPGEIYRAPRSWAERNYHKLIYWNEVEKGGHFASWEQPELFAAELRAAFRSLR